MSDAHETKFLAGSILISVIFAGSAPLRNSDKAFSLLPSVVSKSLINVPFSDAVAKIDPSYDKLKAAIELAWHFNEITFFSSAKVITFTTPFVSSGMARTHESSAVDSETSPNLFSHVIKESEQSRF